MNTGIISMNTVLLFLLMLFRVSGLMVSAPMFSQSGIPPMIKVWFAVLVAFILTPFLTTEVPLVAHSLWGFVWVAAQEFAIGALLGFVAMLFFGAVQLAGHHVTLQMGMGVANAVDPISNQQTPIMGQFYFIVAILLFLMLDVHHHILMALSKSFEVIPLASGTLPLGALAARFGEFGAALFSFSLHIVLPIVGIMLLVEVSMAFMGKIMPQMNIFMVALPIKIGVGLTLMLLTLTFSFEVLTQGFADLVKDMYTLFNPS